jgi:adenylosuccinate synthase
MSATNLKLSTQNNRVSSLENEEDQIKKLETLKKKNAKLNEQLLLKSAEQKRLQEELNALEKEALELFGTSSLDDLRSILVQKRKENNSILEEYETSILDIENQYNELVSEIN